MSPRPSPGPASPRQALLTFRIIGASLGMGVTFFAAISAFLHVAGTATAAPAVDESVMFATMLGVAVAATAAAIVLWRARVAPLLETPPSGPDWRDRAAALQTAVIIVWALVEGAALFAEVVYFLYGDTLAGALGLVLIWVALALTWPKRHWLGADHTR